MEYRLLGSSGCAVSALALGTLTFGNETDQETSFSQLDRFTEGGGTLVDSADVYTDGRAEEIIGGWRAARPFAPGTAYPGDGYVPGEFLLSSAIWARAALTSSALVFACPLRPHPPSGASVSITQLRSARVGSSAASATMAVSWRTTASCLSRSSAPELVRT